MTLERASRTEVDEFKSSGATPLLPAAHVVGLFYCNALQILEACNDTSYTLDQGRPRRAADEHLRA